MKGKRRGARLLLAVLLAAILVLSLAACAKTYTVTFDSAGGSAVASVEAKSKKTIEEPAAPTRDGYAFEKWLKPDGTEFLFGTDTITGDITLTASWKINSYTVTFVTGGGTSVGPQSVEHNGKAVKPDDPEKSGEIFAGWYKDSGFKSVFDFAKETITGSITVYARFELPAENTYTVKFSGTTTEIAARETNDAGILTDLPKPEESGKEFVGWWMSDFEDAEKLTCEYTGQVLKQNITLYAVWKSGSPLVSVNENGVTWESMGVNVSYRVEITAPDLTKETRTVGTTEYEYDFGSKPAGEYVITVTYNNKTTTVYYNNKALARVCLFEVNGFELQFNAVANAQKYLITIECGNTSSEHVAGHTQYDNGASTVFDFSQCEMRAEGIRFVVKAIAEGYIGSESEEYVFERHLEEVTGLSVKAEDETIVWNNVSGAQYYEYKINDGAWTRYERAVSLKEMEPGEIRISVRAVAHGYNNSEPAEYTYIKTRLATPVEITVDGDELKWNAVTGAESYTVLIDGTEYPATGNSMRLPADADWTSMQISVRANGATEAENSLYSDVKRFAATLEGRVEYKEGYLEWSSIIGALKYAVKLNGGEAEELSGTTTRYKVEFDRKGLNVIEICYYDGVGTASEWEPVEVEVYEVTLRYNMEGYESYGTLYRAQNDPLELPAEEVELVGYNFDYWMGETSGTQYVKTKLEDAADLTLYAHWTAKEYTVTFNVIGGTMDGSLTMKVSYRLGYSFPVPESVNTTKTFLGWYDSPNNVGIKYTDHTGKGTDVWITAGDKTLYAGWVDVFVMTKTTQTLNGQTVEGYSVKKGAGIDLLKEVKVPAEYDGLPVVDITSGAFDRCFNLVKILIPDTIKNIEYGSSGGNSTGSPFSYCHALMDVEIYVAHPGLVYETRYTSIDGVLFEYRDTDNRSDLQLNYMPTARRGDYEIPYGVTVLPTNVFGDTNYLTWITVPASVTRIDDSAFSALYLEKIEFLAQPDGETEQTLSLSDRAFAGASNVVELVLPTRFVFDSKYFSYMMDLERIYFTNDNWAYRSMDGLVVNNAADTIVYAPRTFSGENGVFTIPTGITKIAANAFSNAYAASKDKTLWYGCKNITKLVVPEWVQTIGEAAFRSCSNINSIEFLGDAGSVELTIETRAFHGCKNLTKITLPANLVSLGKYAFGDCAIYSNSVPLSKLTDVDVQVTKSEMGEDGTLRCNVLAVDAFRIDPESEYSRERIHTVENVKIGAGVGIFDIGGVFGNMLQKVDVDVNNLNFASEDGVVYSKSFDEIMFYPSLKEGEFVLHENVVTINAGVFAGATLLTKVTLGEKVTSIGDNAFKGCTGLTQVVFADAASVAEGHALTIGDSAFEDCYYLADIVLPAYLTEIGNRAFVECSRSLTEITVPGSVKTVGNEAFTICRSLVTVTFEEGVETIGKEVFKNCGSLKTVNFPASLVSVAEGDDSPFTNMFYGCGSIDKVNIAEGNVKYASVDGIVYGYTEKGEEGSKVNVITDLLYCPVGASGVDGIVDIPKTIERIFAGAFTNNKNITEIKFSEGIEGELDIGEDAFNGCKKLSTLALPTGFKVMKTGLLNGCSSLVTLTIPNTVTEMQVDIFKGCNNIENIIFEEGNEGTPLVLADGTYEVIYDSGSGAPTAQINAVFYGCKKLGTIEFPARLTKLPSYIFPMGCAPEILILPSSITEIAANAFYWTRKVGYETFPAQRLTSVRFKDISSSRLEKIGDSAFYGNGNLAEFQFPDSLKEIGNHAFYGCKSMQTVAFDTENSMLAAVGKSAFESCSNLQSVTIPDASESIGASAFSSCAALSDLNLPENGKLKAIGASAFSGCKALTSVTVPASVETIGASAFSTCSALTSVVFAVYPEDHEHAGKNSLVSIGDSAFNQTSLTSFTIMESISESGVMLGASLFNKVKTLRSITLSKSVVSIESMVKGSYVTEISIPNDSLYLNADETLPLIYNGEGTMIQLTFGPLGDENGVFRVPEGTTIIGERAFSGQSFKKVILPYTVREIGTFAFENCFNLEEVAVETDSASGEGGYSNLTTVGEAAFNYCYSLKKVDFSRTRITHIQKQTFYHCEALSEMLLPSTLEIIGLATDSTTDGNAFAYCRSLTAIELPEGLKRINGASNFAFSGLEEIEFPESLEFVGDATFKYTENFKKATFNSDMTWKTSTFYGYIFQYSSVEEVVLSEKMTTLSPNMFENAKSLKIVTYNGYVPKDQSRFEEGLENVLPPLVNTVPYELFNNCAMLRSMDLSNITTYSVYSASSSYNTVFGNCTSLEKVTLNSTLTSLVGRMFSGCTSLTSIDLPDTLTFLGKEKTFEKSGLVSIKIPQGVKNFGTTETDCAANSSVYLFDGCASLETVILPSSPVDFKIGGYVFRGCTALKTIKCGNEGEANKLDGVTLVGQYAFSGSAIENLNLPDVETVGTYAFGVKSADYDKGTYVSGLKTVSLPKLNTFGTYMFSYCKELTSVTLSENAEALGNYMFDGCSALSTLTLPSKLQFLGTYTFRNSGITEIEIPASVEHIGTSKGSSAAVSSKAYVFQNCTQLTSVTLPAGLKTIGAYVFDNCPLLETITYDGSEQNALPATVTVVGDYTFRGCAALEELDISGVKTAGTDLFQNCASLENVTLGTSLTSLPNYMFNGCSSLLSIDLSSVKTLGTNIFQNCSSLEEVTLGADLTTLPNYTFDGCSALASIDLENIKSVGTYCFRNCASLQTAELPAATSVGNYAFNACSGLTTAKLPVVTSLGTYVFYDCVKLSNVQLNMELKTIPESAFRDCKALETIQLPNQLETIDTYAFRESGLIRIEFPALLTYVDFSAFGYCYNLELIVAPNVEGGYYVDEETGWLMDTEGTLLMTLGNLEGNVVVPEGVKAIGASAFEGRRSMTGVQLPDTLERIGRLAFWQTGLTSIVIPASVVEIEYKAFAYSYIETAELNCKDAVFGESVFTNCPNLISATFCDGFEVLGNKMFQYCDKLETVNLPASIVFMGVETFRYSGLQRITIPEGVEHLGSESGVAAIVGTNNYLFADCAKLTSVVLPSGLATMSAQCFRNCTALESITYTGFEGEGNSLPTSLTLVGSFAFSNTTMLKQLAMPGVTDVGQYVFGHSKDPELASGIETVSLPSLRTIGVGMFRNCTALKNVTLGEGLETLGSYMFYNCTSLESIDLPSSITYLSTYTFQNSGLTSIEIPASVEHMGTTANTAATASTNNSLFAGCTSLTSVVLPAGLLTMGSNTFKDCTSLSRVIYSGYEGTDNVLPQGLSVIGSSSFANCAFDNITIPEALKTTNKNVFTGCALERLVYNAIAMTTTSVFKDMVTLETVEFGDKVTSIPGQTFYGCTNLKNVTLPETIESISYDAFRDCNSMTEIVLPESAILESGRVFWGWTPEQKIYVKQSAYMAFRLWDTSWMEECRATIIWDYTETQA